MTNPYTVLGVTSSSTQDEIKKAYKKLARQFHPDINKSAGAESRFKEVNAAYDIVGDPDKRKLFDEFGDVALKPGFNPETARAWSRAGAGPGPRGGSPDYNFDFGGGSMNMEEFLGSIFGGGGFPGAGGARRAAPGTGRPFGGAYGGREMQGEDQHVEMAVEALATFTGDEQRFIVHRPNGSQDQLKVRIPAGAKHNGKLRLKGQGLPPHGGGPCGDLIIHLRVNPHPLLRQDGDDLEMDVPITIYEAMVGANITVPTPTGDVKVAVPAGVEAGQKLRIKGRGVQRRNRPGDLYLVLMPQVPSSRDDEILAAAKALQGGYGGDVRRDLKV